MAKKAAKKYDLSRKDIAKRLDELYSRLNDIDTFVTSPDEVSNELSSIAEEIGLMCEQVQEEV